jgi:hypothetical protein
MVVIVMLFAFISCLIFCVRSCFEAHSFAPHHFSYPDALLLLQDLATGNPEIQKLVRFAVHFSLLLLYS